MCEIHQGPGAETLPNQRPDICLQLTCPVTETTPCHAERTIYAIDTVCDTERSGLAWQWVSLAGDGLEAGCKDGKSLEFEVYVEQRYFRFEPLFLHGTAFRPTRTVLLGFGFPFRCPGFETVRVPSGAPFRRFQIVLPVKFVRYTWFLRRKNATRWSAKGVPKSSTRWSRRPGTSTIRYVE